MDPEEDPKSAPPSELENRPQPIRLLESYEILSRIASGGMGIVYRARHIYLNREVALKVVDPALLTPRGLSRFHKEAKVLSRLKHKNIAQLLDFGVFEGQEPFLAIEFIDGETLHSYVASNGPMRIPEFKECFAQISSALHHAHLQGVVHRDVKPGNIMLRREDNSELSARLVDFGIARTSDSKDAAATQFGNTIGTPLYASPEQFSGGNSGDSTDQYSLGCVMFFALTGKPPFTAESIVELADLHRNADPPLDLLLEHEEMRSELVELVERLMSKNPEERFESMDQVAAAIDEIEEQVDEQRVSQPLVPPLIFSSRKIWMLPTVMIIFLGSSWVFSEYQKRKKSPPVDYSTHKMADSEPVERPVMEKVVDRNPTRFDMEMIYPQQIIEEISSRKPRPVINLGWNVKVNDDLVEKLGSPVVEDLNLKFTSVSSLSFLRKFPNLRNLDLSTTQISGESLANLASLHHLENLELNGTHITEKDLESCPPLPSLQRIALGNTPVKALTFYKSFPNVKNLTLRECRLDDAGMDDICRFKELRDLTISKTNVTIEGVRKVACCKNLVDLSIVDLGISKEDIDDLRNKLPNCNIGEHSKVETLAMAANIQRERNDLPGALKTIDEAIRLSRQFSKTSPALGNLLYWKASMLADGGKLDEALKFLKSADDIETYGDVASRRIANFEIGTAFSKQYNPRSIEFAVKASELALQQGYYAEAASYLRSAGVWASQAGRNKEARELFTRSLKAANSVINSSPEQSAFTNLCLADLKSGEGDLEGAMESLGVSRKMIDKLPQATRNVALFDFYVIKSQVMLRYRKLDEAEALLSEARLVATRKAQLERVKLTESQIKKARSSS